MKRAGRPIFPQKMKLKNFLSLAFGVALATSVAQADTLVIKGSDTLGAKLVPQLAEAYKASHPGTSFKIAAEGSATGFAALLNGTADLAMSSRRSEPTEVSEGLSKNITLHPTIVAYDGIAVITNAGNPVKNLTKKQVEQIFTGDIKDWSAVGGTPGPISIYTRNTSSGTYKDFASMAMKKRNYAGSAQKMAGNEQIAAEVGKNAKGIGYVGIAYTKAAGVRAIAVEGVIPSIATIQSKAYAYSRPTFYFTNGAPTGLAADFTAFTTSTAGQKIVQQVGFAPIK
jgi:phosphate transport system substrate-binding protein